MSGASEQRANVIPDGVYASPEALELHRSLIIFDCLSLSYLIDEPYFEWAIEAGVTATNLTVATEGQSWDEVLGTIDTALTKIAKSRDMVVATHAQEIRDARALGKLAVILGTQGSEVVGKQLTRVRILYRLGVRFMGLAYTGATLFADGCGETRDAGLTFLGKDFIEAINELPVLLDLSHTGHRSRYEAAQLAKNPACTHSNAYSVNPNDRNTKDETARIIAAKGGVMGITGLVRAVAPKDSTIEHMLDHTDHWVRTVGPQRTGIGLDLTEGFQDAYRAGKSIRKAPKWREIRPDIFGTPEEFFTQSYPRGLQSIRQLPNFTHGLLARGYSPDSIRQIMGESWLRSFEAIVG